MKAFPLTGLVLFLLLFAVSCRKTTTTTVIEYKPIVHSWLPDSALIGYQKIILNAVKVDDSTLAISNKLLLTFINANNLNALGIGSSTLPLFGAGYALLTGPSLTNTLIAYPLDSSHFYISNNRNINSNIGSLSYTPTFSNLSSIAVKGIPQPTYGNGFSIINNRYMLVPFSTDNINNVASVALLKVDTIPGLTNSLQFSSTKELVLHAPGSFPNGFNFYNYSGFSFFQKFFLTLNYQFFRVDTLGNIKSFGSTPAGSSASSVMQMFTLGGYLFAITNASILVSQDKGETWSVFSTLSPGVSLANLTYQNSGADLYAYYNYQIWRVTLAGQSITLTELDNDGLETNKITGITKVGKYAFVSTLAGLYYRDTTSFHSPKK